MNVLCGQSYGGKWNLYKGACATLCHLWGHAPLQAGKGYFLLTIIASIASVNQNASPSIVSNLQISCLDLQFLAVSRAIYLITLFHAHSILSRLKLQLGFKYKNKKNYINNHSNDPNDWFIQILK